MAASDPKADPAVAPERIEAIYDSLAKMQVDLDQDPLALGPKRLNGKIALCRTMLSDVQAIFLDISQSLHRYRRSLRSAAADFKLQMKELLAHDPEVRMGRNVADRDAIASTRLRAEQETIDHLTACVEDLEAVMVVVRAKQQDLKDIQGRLRDQLKVCQEEINLGARWGKGIPTARIEDPSGDSVMELTEALLRVPGKSDAVKQPPTTIPLEMVGSASKDETDEALKDLPGSDIPEVRHPDESDGTVFEDDGLSDLFV